MLVASPSVGPKRKRAEPHPWQAPLGQIVVTSNVKSKPQLSGQLGIARSFDPHSRRYAVLLLDGLTAVALTPSHLTAWRESVESTPGAGTAEQIANAETPAEMLRFMREGCVLSSTGGIARACFERFLEFPILTTGRELTNGGAIEMLVQALDAQMQSRADLFFLMFTISNTVVAGDDGTRENLAPEMKDRAVRAGIFSLLDTVLSMHTTSDIQCMALSLFTAVATGGGFAETEARREAAGKYTGKIVAVMKLQAHSSAVQHFGIQAISAIVASNTERDPAPARRADAAVARGSHMTIIKAMHCHGHINGEHGISTHSLETTALGVDEEGRGQQIQIGLPGSVLLSGCEALQLLIHSRHGHRERRIAALNQAGALKAIASAVRYNPTSADFQDAGAPQDLTSMQFMQPLIIKLYGNRDFTGVLEPEDHAALMMVLRV